MKLIYIPFNSDDSLFDLYPMAQRWIERIQSTGKYDPTILLYGSDTLSKRPDIVSALKKGECSIYILSHGQPSPHFNVANQKDFDEDYQEISIEEVSKRFQASFVDALAKPSTTTSDFSNKNTIKLFFCDDYAKDQKARNMAHRFRRQLNSQYQSLNVEYYNNVLVSLPPNAHDSKKAYRQYEHDLKLFSFQMQCHIGSARTYRRSLNDGQPSFSSMFVSVAPVKPVIFPKFGHPLILEFAKGIVQMIQSDPAVFQNKEVVIQELLESMPKNLDDYLVQQIILTTDHTRLTLTIDLKKLIPFLQQHGAIEVDQSIDHHSQTDVQMMRK